jgi:hypothetical protein
MAKDKFEICGSCRGPFCVIHQYLRALTEENYEISNQGIWTRGTNSDPGLHDYEDGSDYETWYKLFYLVEGAAAKFPEWFYCPS